MLKLSPRSITAIVLLFFAAILGLQHSVYVLSLGDAATARSAEDAVARTFAALPWLERLDYDLHLRQLRRVAPSPAVTVVEVNERSIRELGQFPFARKVYREFLQKLEGYGARVVAFDITFPEREGSDAVAELSRAAGEVAALSGKDSPAARALNARLRALDGDASFASGLRETKLPVVLGYAFAGEQEKVAAPLSRSAEESLRRYDIFRRQLADNSFLLSMSGHQPILPHAELLSALGPRSSLGFFNALPDPDSVIRRAAGVIGFDNMAVASLAVQATSAYLGVAPALSGESGLRLRDKEEAGRLDVPLSPEGSFLLRYYGGKGEFPYVEFADVVAGRAPAELLRGKIIFVGATATGLRDLRASPFTENYPGVEVHATFASNVLQRHYLEKDGRYFFAGYLFLLALGLVCAFFVYRLQPLFSSLLTLGVLAAFQYAAQALCFERGLVVPTLLPCLGGLSVLFAGVLYRFFSEEKEKRAVRTAFSRYVSGAVVGEILKDPSKLKLGGQKKELTVMFCDLVGFTKLSEHLEAGQLTLLLNEYFTRMTAIILRNHGTLDKYMGDAIMCFWGAPLDLPGHADFACATALEMLGELERINEEWRARYGLSIGLRIGLHTGEMVVGNMGSEQVFSYTVMGDNVNLGSRLEGVNNFYGTKLLVSAAVREATTQAFRFRPLDHVRVKGKEEAVEILELVSVAAGPDPEWMHAFASGLAAYRAGRWDEAAAAFGTCLTLKPGDGPSEVLLARVGELRAAPPADWSGVWKFASK